MMMMTVMRVTVTTTTTTINVVENIIEKIENSVIIIAVTKEVVAENTRDIIDTVEEEEVVDLAPIPTASPPITIIIHLLLCTLDLDLDLRRTERRRGRTRIRRRRDQNIGMMGIIEGIEETTIVVKVVEVEVEIEVIKTKSIIKKRKDVYYLLLDLPMWMKLVPLWKSWNDVNKRNDDEDD